MSVGGGRFDFDDGGTYCGGWEDGKAHGYGVCTGPKGMGEYSGAWQYGFEISGVYTWPSGNAFQGQWFQGKRHGLGVESKGRWVYRGEWTQGFKGRYGIRQSTTSGARYEGTWTTGLQDGYGCESYADGGMYQGQWLRGTRHGYGIRQSVPYGLASHYRPKGIRESLTSLRSENEEEQVVKQRDRKLDESRGGFVLKAKSDETPPVRRRSLFEKKGNTISLRRTILSGLKLKKQRSTGDINDSPKRQTGSVRSTFSNVSHGSMDSTQSGKTSTSHYTDSNLSFVSQDDITDTNVTETYMGEWKNDKRCGFGVSERSDGLKYEGEWFNNRKYGYGTMTFKNGDREEGKYKNNILISSGRKNKLFLFRTSKLRERVDTAVVSAQRAAQISLQKAEIAVTRMANARAKSDQANTLATKAKQDCELARVKAKQFAPEFHQPGVDLFRKKLEENHDGSSADKLQPNHQAYNSTLQNRSSFRDNNDNISSIRADVSHNLDTAWNDSRSRLGPPTGSQDYSSLGGRDMQYLNVDYDQADSSQNSSPVNRGGSKSGSVTPSPSVKIRRYSFLAGSRRGRGFSELFNSTILNDHFGQYDGDSGVGSEFVGFDMNHIGADKSPDSGVGDTDDYEAGRARSLPRRRTLPAIVVNQEAAKSAAKLGKDITDVTHSSENISKKLADSVLIENGIRKLVRAERNDNSSIKNLADRSYKTRNAAVAMGDKRGSLPDISVVKDFSTMPRSEVFKLSTARRNEIRRLQDLDERRRQGDVTVILGDLKDWCQQRQLLVLVIALNVSLATMFFNLFS